MTDESDSTRPVSLSEVSEASATPALPSRPSSKSFDINHSFKKKSTNKPILMKRSLSMGHNFDSDVPEWRRDASVKRCTTCDRKFSSFRRRHHCRLCGDVYCHKCCKKYRRVPYYLSPLGGVVSNARLEPRRLCQVCCNRYDHELDIDPDAVVRPKSVPTTPLTSSSDRKSTYSTTRTTEERQHHQQQQQHHQQKGLVTSTSHAGIGRSESNETEIGEMFGTQRSTTPTGMNNVSIIKDGRRSRSQSLREQFEHGAMDEARSRDSPVSHPSSGTEGLAAVESKTTGDGEGGEGGDGDDGDDGSDNVADQEEEEDVLNMDDVDDEEVNALDALNPQQRTFSRTSSIDSDASEMSIASASTISTNSRFKKSQGVTINNRKKFLSQKTKDLLKIQKEQLKKAKKIALREIKKIKEKIKIVEDKLKRRPNDDEYCRRWERVHYALTQQLNKHILENQFPRSMRWMLRIVVPPSDANELLFIGIRDFNVETLDADFGVTLGHNQEILLNVTNVHCIASLYKLKLTGPSLLGKALNQLISSRRINVEVTGAWVLPLKHGKRGNKRTEKWYVDWKRAHFKLSLIKSVSGNATLKLPSRLVNWILNTILPGLISEAIIFILPNAIAPLINSGTNTASFNGHVSIVGEIATETWRASLVKSSQARRLLNITLEEAQLLEQICRASDRGKAAGLKSNASCAVSYCVVLFVICVIYMTL
jgi:hypothetical protein